MRAGADERSTRYPDSGPRPGLVSILTPAFDAHATLDRAVRSAQAQTYPDWEMIIVSDDRTDYEQLLRDAGLRDERLRFLSTGCYGSGPNLPRNLALSAARGEFVTTLDADDLFYRERIDRLVPEAAAFGMAGDNVLVVSETTEQPLGTLFAQDETVHQLDMQACSRMSTPISFLFRRDLVNWQWEEDLPLGADTIFNLRGIEQVGWAPVLARVLREYRVRQGSICHSDDSHHRADESYELALQRLGRDGLGFETSQGRDVVRDMLVHKRYMNTHFADGLKKGVWQNFQEFVAAGSGYGGIGLEPCPAFAT